MSKLNKFIVVRYNSYIVICGISSREFYPREIYNFTNGNVEQYVIKQGDRLGQCVIKHPSREVISLKYDKL